MMLKIAWRNVWRKRTRSLTVIVAVAIGLWAGAFVLAFYTGIMNQRIKDVIETEVSHVQVHQPKFREEDHNLQYLIPGDMGLKEKIESDPDVLGTAERLVLNGMISTTRTASGVRIYGVDPESESKIRGFDTKIVDGEFFPGKSRSPEIVVSKKIADKMKLEIGDLVKLDFQATDCTMVSPGYKIAGIYKTYNAMADEGNIYVLRDQLGKYANTGDGVHEIAIRLKENGLSDEKAIEWNKKYDGLLFESWLDISPGMRYSVEAVDIFMMVIIGIILFALMFGIVNTMLMAILERVREMGVLMAVGMDKQRIFFMIMLETMMLTFAGAPLGLGLAFLSIYWSASSGIDLGAAGQAMEEFGYSPIIYPELGGKYYLMIAGMVIVITTIASLYPAFRGTRLKPVEAIRKI